MSNPFPGVDPFIEDREMWQDFHHTFITCWRDAIADALPDDYIARIDERFEIVEAHSQSSRQRLPDVSVMHDPRAPTADQSSTRNTSSAIVEPITRRLVIEAEEREAFIEIYRDSDEQLVAVLELLSPTNKHGVGHAAYLGKRNELLLQDLHLVELDLLIRGERLPVEPDLPAGDYFVYVSRSDKRPWCDIYPWRMTDPSPSIPIPLLSGDADLRIDLQELYNTVYDRCRFGKQRHRLYAQPLSLPVDAVIRDWAARLSGQTLSKS